jgi:hypothetical protein
VLCRLVVDSERAWTVEERFRFSTISGYDFDEERWGWTSKEFETFSCGWGDNALVVDDDTRVIKKENEPAN